MKNQKYDYELYSAYLYHRTEIASYLENYIKDYLDKLAPCMLYFRVNIKFKNCHCTKHTSNIQILQICTMGLQKKKKGILKTVGGVIRTIGIPYKQHFVNKEFNSWHFSLFDKNKNPSTL